MTRAEHLTDDEIQEFLDGALDPAHAVRADRHLGTCPACMRRKESMERLFASIEAWEERPPARDLSAAVVGRLSAGRARPAWRVAFLVQAVAALAILAAGWPLISTLPIPASLGFDPAGLAASTVSIEPWLRAAVGEAEAWVVGSASLTAWWPALLAAGVAAIAGNSLLLSRSGGVRPAGRGRS